VSRKYRGKSTLLERYGKRWTYALAIHDTYFDYAAPVLT
jgi:ribose transport system substrate-binding protein